MKRLLSVILCFAILISFPMKTQATEKIYDVTARINKFDLDDKKIPYLRKGISAIRLKPSINKNGNVGIVKLKLDDDNYDYTPTLNHIRSVSKDEYPMMELRVYGKSYDNGEWELASYGVRRFVDYTWFVDAPDSSRRWWFDNGLMYEEGYRSVMFTWYYTELAFVFSNVNALDMSAKYKPIKHTAIIEASTEWRLFEQEEED